MGRGIWAGEQSAVETSGLVCGEQRRQMGRWMVYIEDGWAGGRQAKERNGPVVGRPMETDEPVNGIY